MYDLFISYSSYDRPWAARLHGDLRKYFPNPIFWDRDPAALPLGVNWADELKRHSEEAKHLVLLWSDKAAQSNEVKEEVANFLANVKYNPRKDNSERRLFYIPLTTDRYGAYQEQRQGLTELRDLQTYDPNVEDRVTARLEAAPHHNAWRRIVGIIRDNIENAESTKPNNLAILVSTTSNIDSFEDSLNKDFGPGPTAAEFLQTAGLTLEQATERYGPTAFDWTRFGSDRTIMELMEDLRATANAGLLGAESRYRFHWKRYDLIEELVRLRADENGRRRWLEELTELPTIIIVDGLSLFNPVCLSWFQELQDWINKEHIILVALAPHEVPTAARMYEGIRLRGRSVFEKYFRPQVPPAGAFARSRVNLEHVSDIEPLIRRSLGSYYLNQKNDPNKVLTKMGS